jgi:hypothetical protein
VPCGRESVARREVGGWALGMSIQAVTAGIGALSPIRTMLGLLTVVGTGGCASSFREKCEPVAGDPDSLDQHGTSNALY